MSDIEKFANELQDLINRYVDKVKIIQMFDFLDMVKFQLYLRYVKQEDESYGWPCDDIGE
jgi:hypothetical protein